jgi:hypothetical protein
LALSRRRRGVSPCYPAKPNAEPPITGVAATAQARRDPKPQHSNKPNSSSLPHFARAKREPAADGGEECDEVIGSRGRHAHQSDVLRHCERGRHGRRRPCERGLIDIGEH